MSTTNPMKKKQTFKEFIEDPENILKAAHQANIDQAKMMAKTKPTPMTKIREEFEKKWRENYRGQDPYWPDWEGISDWFINRFQQELSSLEEEIANDTMDLCENSQEFKNKVLAIIRQHKEG